MRHDLAMIRQQSLATATSFGMTVNQSLPLLESCSIERTADEIIGRALCIHALAACAYGFNNKKAMAWLEREGLWSSLTMQEILFLDKLDGPRTRYQHRVEALWAMSWSLSIVSKMDLLVGCDPSFVLILPNLKSNESSLEYKSKAKLRDEIEIVSRADLMYCLHWSLQNAAITHSHASPRIPLYAVEQRRLALDWILSSEEWEEISLDT